MVDGRGERTRANQGLPRKYVLRRRVLRNRGGITTLPGRLGGLEDRYVSVSLQAGRVNYIPGSPSPFLSFLHAAVHRAAYRVVRLRGH